MLSLNLKLSQTQKLSPQQIQYQKLLQLNTLALEQRIKTELEINPMLEEVGLEELDLKQNKDDNSDNNSDDFEDSALSGAEEFSAEDFMNQSDLDDSKLNQSSGEEIARPLAKDKEGLNERLLDQLYLQKLPEHHIILGENIIASLGTDGYLKQDLDKILEDIELFEHIKISEKEAEKVLSIIQNFDPPGVAARSLQECLLIQLRASSFDKYYSYLAEKMIENYFDDFKNKRFDVIQKNLVVTKETLRSILDVILKLNPKPGEGSISSDEANQISPDFLIEKEGDNFIVTLNDRSMQSLTISKTYLEMLNTNKRKRKISAQQKAAHKFLREKFESAKWFIFSIQQRRETLLKIMRAIFEKQYEFFEIGTKALKPMIYKDIADEIMMDISTISRVARGKYVQSPVGIHELKYFFSEGLSTDSGGEISNKHIKEIIKDIIESESKKSPLSDDKIAKILVDKGIHIARRTVAKYREQLMIPVARMRKEL